MGPHLCSAATKTILSSERTHSLQNLTVLVILSFLFWTRGQPLLRRPHARPSVQRRAEPHHTAETLPHTPNSTCACCRQLPFESRSLGCLNSVLQSDPSRSGPVSTLLQKRRTRCCQALARTSLHTSYQARSSLRGKGQAWVASLHGALPAC